jgi:hypothetical protein
MGCFLLICILAVLGFVYVWIANVVGQTEVPVVKGMVIVFVAGLAGWAVRAALAEAGGAVLQLGGTGVNFLMLIVMTRFLAPMDWAKSAIVATIFTVLMWAVAFLLVLMAP